MIFLLACGWNETAVFGGGDVVLRVTSDTGTLEAVVPSQDLPDNPSAWDTGSQPESCGQEGAQVRSHRRHRGFFRRLSGDWYDHVEVTVRGAQQIDADTCVVFDAELEVRPPEDPHFARLNVILRRGEVEWDWRGVASQSDTAWDTGAFARSEVGLAGSDGREGSIALDLSGRRWEDDWGTELEGRGSVTWSMTEGRVDTSRWTAW